MSLETTALILILGTTWLATLLWVLGLFFTVKSIAGQSLLSAAIDAGPSSAAAAAPLVSVLIPARNEEHRILAECLDSIAMQDYSHLEIFVVNDRSTDKTGEIARHAAQQHSNLQVIDGAEPPQGWLGKPHALEQAYRAARGDWILATDADMVYAKATVRTAINYAIRNNYDALTLIPHIDCLTFWERVFIPSFGWFIMIALPVKRVNDPARREAIGIGGFFLIRRAALERVGGYEAVKDEVAEDLRMAELLKGAGQHLHIAYAPGLIATRMQTNLREIWEGFTKNLFAGTRFSPLRTVFAATTIFLFSVIPCVVAGACLAVLLTEGASRDWAKLLLVPTFSTWTLQTLTFAAVGKAWGVPLRYAPTAPLGHALFVAILLNSALKIITGSGVTWKGRKLYDRQGGITPPRGVAR